ncbi:MAG: MBL fold metallo-hydrolase [Pseudomonadota bacterium]
MRFSVLASGSSGNACYIETAHAKILIDAGLSGREIIKRLELIDVRPDGLDALFITHEHMDHIKGAGPLARRLDIPVFSNNRTLKRGMKIMGNLHRPIPVQTGQAITIKDLQVETFTKCHDAVDPMGLIISSDGISLGLITDLGRSTVLVEDRLKRCNALMIEFNHDQKMLEEGPYPLDLKRRIRGPEGHLSNQQAGELLEAIGHGNLNVVVLAHLSKINNLADLAFREASQVLERSGLDQARIVMSHQDHPTEFIDLYDHLT